MINKQTKFDVLCFGGEDWWYHNRGHIDFQLMRRFAQMGTVLYVNSIVMQKPNLSQGKRFIHKLVRKSKSVFRGLQKSDAGFWVYSPFSMPVHHISWARPLDELLLRSQINHVNCKLRLSKPIIWIVCPTACDIAIKISKNKLVYQRTDRYEDFPNLDIEMVRAYDLKLKAQADLTIYVNKKLFEEESGQCKKPFFLDHGVDYKLFTLAECDRTLPADIAQIPKPIAGYFGALDDHKLNINFIESIIDLLPYISFVFVGKQSCGFSRLLEKKNVWMLGQKDYEQIPHYGKCFDVAILPWVKNRWTEAANPIKVKEYLALGKPFVATPVFTQLQEYLDVAYVANTPEEFARCITRALKEDSPKRIAARRKKVKKDTWDSKAELLLHELFKE